MSIWEFDQELHDEAMREDGKVEGKIEGKIEGRAEGRIEEIFNSVQEGDYSVERGAQKLNLSVEQFEEKMMAGGYKIPELI